MKRFLLLTFILISASRLQAQDITFDGKIIDNEGIGVAGAVAFCKEIPSKGTVADVKGNFSFTIPAGVKTIVFASLGMKDVEYDIVNGKRKNVVITMEYDYDQLDQVVVTGYAQTTMKRITGSVGIMDASKFESKPLSSVSSLMQGEVAGVQIKAVSGRPGSQSKIRIRGTGSLSGSSEPLWVVDGVPLQNDSPSLSSEQLATGGFDDIFVNGVGNINPNDIESITILKDASAAAIYGSRASSGVIVVTTKRGQAGDLKVAYNNNLTWSFRPERNLSLMNSSEKLAWEQQLWDEFSKSKYEKSLTDNTVFYPVVGIVGQIRAGAGKFSGMSVEEQDQYINSLKDINTDWYSLLFRNAFSHNHHLSLSGGTNKATYYVSFGVNSENGMLRRNDYQRYNLSSNLNIRPSDNIAISIGAEASRQESLSPDSAVNEFTYAYFANPYEKAFDENGYVADNTWFNLGYYNGRGVEQVLPKNGFSILRELDNNYTKTANSAATARAQVDIKLFEQLRFVSLASWSWSNNASDKIVDKSTFTAFKDRLGNDDKSQTNLYGNISQNRTGRDSYVLRGHFAYNQDLFANRSFSGIAGAEIRGSSSSTIFTKRYNYDPVTGTSSLPSITGPADQWLSEVERLNGQYFTDNRYASFYASGDYYIGKKFVFNASVRTDGSSRFGSNSQFNPTWSAGGAWHLDQEKWMPDIFSRATLRLAGGYTGDISTSATHQLVMQYYQQQYRVYEGTSYLLGHIPSAPNPNLGWEKTADLKIGLDLGLWNDRLKVNTEAYLRQSSDVVAASQVQSTAGFSYVYFNSANIINSGIETTVSGDLTKQGDFSINASVNFAYNYNKVTKYTPTTNTITSKDRYIEGYPIGAIMSGKYGGIDKNTGLYLFRLREDANLSSATDLNNPDNYRHFLGTTIAPFTGGFNFTFNYKSIRLGISGVYSFGNKVYDKIDSPASYMNALHSGVSTEEIQSQYSDLYSNHLNVKSDRTDRWTQANPSGTKYPRIYDRFDAKYFFAATTPMDYSIVDAIYLKDLSYLRVKTILLSWSLPDNFVKKVKMKGVSLNLSLNNFITITGYDGMDPEVPGASYPTTRSASAGINIDF